MSNAENEKPISLPGGSELSPQRGDNSEYPADEFAAQDEALLNRVTSLIDESHARVSAKINSEMTELYWQVGTEIEHDLLDGKRAAYGSQIVKRLSDNLTLLRGRGWSVKQLWHCRRLATAFPDHEIVSALQRELNWTCIKTIM